MSSQAHADHRAFLNRYYGVSRFIYDVTRKYYLFGRDAALRELERDGAWRRLIEVGPGTGRNLRHLHGARPDAELGAIEASDAMLEHARARCPWARIEHGFAEDAPMRGLLGGLPERILFSYCLSMVGDRKAALDNARGALAEGGEVVVVDFADFSGFPTAVGDAFRKYLRAFHVVPLDAALLADASSLRWGPGHYYVIARFSQKA